MKNHVNFYENLAEAQMRLRSTVILYDGQPYHVTAITDHKGDGKFRIYLDPMNYDASKRNGGNRPEIGHIHPSASAQLGEYLDKWISDNPDAGFLRRRMDSPLFNKFRPFPLGMCNFGSNCFYLERQPTRQREQGLTRSMIYENRISAGTIGGQTKSSGLNYVDMWNENFKNTVIGKYPTAQECLDALKDPEVENEALGFHRQFALLRGPMEMIFLAHKEYVIGVLPNNSFDEVRLSRKFPQYKEVTEELGLFGKVFKQ